MFTLSAQTRGRLNRFSDDLSHFWHKISFFTHFNLNHFSNHSHLKNSRQKLIVLRTIHALFSAASAIQYYPRLRFVTIQPILFLDISRYESFILLVFQNRFRPCRGRLCHRFGCDLEIPLYRRYERRGNFCPSVCHLHDYRGVAGTACRVLYRAHRR